MKDDYAHEGTLQIADSFIYSHPDWTYFAFQNAYHQCSDHLNYHHSNYDVPFVSSLASFK